MSKYYDPLSDMSRIKEYLMNLFLDKEDLVNLIMPTLDNDHFTLKISLLKKLDWMYLLYVTKKLFNYLKKTNNIIIQ